MVAVLVPTSVPAPLSAQSALPTPPPSSSEAQELPAASATSTFRVQWRTVVTGHGDELQQEIAGGLQPGERIALRPAPLRELTEKQGPDAIVQLSA